MKIKHVGNVNNRSNFSFPPTSGFDTSFPADITSFTHTALNQLGYTARQVLN